MTKIKVCGLKRPEDITFANKYHPNYIGFVFAKSSRQVTPETARELKALLDPDILSVGVFVNAPMEEISFLYKEGIIDLAQLHGDESTEYLQQLKTLHPSLPTIRAVRVQSREQILEAEQLPCDYLLLDTWSPNAYGGSGHGFDKSLIPPLTKPWFLAGGLTPDNVCDNILACHPYGVDASSSLESDGYKDKEKIKNFVEHIRRIG